jgi:enoyl-CoA hydratase/carnithine racemase
MSDGQVVFRQDGVVGTVIFDRPKARNAMTMEMYRQFHAICEQVTAEDRLRVLVLRGAGGQAFISGTDIAWFTGFTSGADGVEYERELETHVAALEAVPATTVAVVEGWATGGGLVIAAACDLRVAEEGARFGVPIARTLGNTVSLANHLRLVQTFGVACAKRMLMLGDTIGVQEAQALGFIAAAAPAAELDAAVDRVVARLAANAPLTMRATKEAVRRLGTTAMAADDLVEMCFGSADFRRGVAAFLGKTRPEWEGK